MDVAFPIRFFIFGLLGAFLVIAAIVVIVIIVVAANRNKTVTVYKPQEQPHSTPAQQEIIKSLGETIKELRVSRNMTQEFVAESLGVSRQAVSKWENGTSEPTTSNLVALAKLFETEPEELLKKLIK